MRHRFLKDLGLLAISTLILSGAYFIIENGRQAPMQAVISEGGPEPVVVEKKTFGTSTKGKPIEGYVIGRGEHVILLFSAIHGNEMGTVELMNSLVKEIEKDIDLVSLDNKVIIIPIVNPDGYYDRIDKLNANEVNLNLNFETTEWQKYGPEENFAGTGPFSEVESLVIKQVVEMYKPDLMISFHSKGSLVSPESEDASIRLAQWYVQRTGYEYYDLWDYFGTATRWFTETTGNPSITVELTDHFKSDWSINRKPLLELISSASFSVIHQF